MEKFIARIFLIGSGKHASLNDTKILNDFLNEHPGCFTHIHKDYLVISNFTKSLGYRVVGDIVQLFDDEVIFDSETDLLLQIDHKITTIAVQQRDVDILKNVYYIPIEATEAMKLMIENTDPELKQLGWSTLLKKLSRYKKYK